MKHKAMTAARRKHNLYHRFRDIDNPRYKVASRSVRAEIRKAKRNLEKKLTEKLRISSQIDWLIDCFTAHQPKKAISAKKRC